MSIWCLVSYVDNVLFPVLYSFKKLYWVINNFLTLKLNHEKVMSMYSNQHHFKEEVKSMFYFVLRDIVGIEYVIHYLQEAHGPYQSHEQMQCGHYKVYSCAF